MKSYSNYQFHHRRFYLIHARNGLRRVKQKQISVASACGLSRVGYGNIEQGKSNMTLITALKIAEQLNITYDDFCKAELAYQISKLNYAKMNGH